MGKKLQTQYYRLHEVIDYLNGLADLEKTKYEIKKYETLC